MNCVEVMRRLDRLRYIGTPEACVPKMLKVGLTGSIAVGKSFVLSVLGELGGQVIDADEIAREVV